MKNLIPQAQLGRKSFAEASLRIIQENNKSIIDQKNLELKIEEERSFGFGIYIDRLHLTLHLGLRVIQRIFMSKRG